MTNPSQQRSVSNGRAFENYCEDWLASKGWTNIRRLPSNRGHGDFQATTRGGDEHLLECKSHPCPTTMQTALSQARFAKEDTGLSTVLILGCDINLLGPRARRCVDVGRAEGVFAEVLTPANFLIFGPAWMRV